MTQDEVVKLWQEANGWSVEDYTKTLEELQAFANLVAAKEREACAKLCEELKPFGFELKLQRATADDCATAIRARGEQA